MFSQQNIKNIWKKIIVINILNQLELCFFFI